MICYPDARDSLSPMLLSCLNPCQRLQMYKTRMCDIYVWLYDLVNLIQRVFCGRMFQVGLEAGVIP